MRHRVGVDELRGVCGQSTDMSGGLAVVGSSGRLVQWRRSILSFDNQKADRRVLPSMA